MLCYQSIDTSIFSHGITTDFLANELFF